MMSFLSMDELTGFVHQKMCAFDNLDPSQCPLYSAGILRAGRPCGMFFRVKGPRLLKSHAVWSTTEKRILFYDSKGERVAEVMLKDCPSLEDRAAA